MTVYKILFPDNHGDDWEKAYEYKGIDPNDVVYDCCEERFWEWEYPSGSLDFLVRDTETGIVTQVSVKIDLEPVFHTEEQTFGPKRNKMGYL